ncbi:hypothetical protein GH983_23800 (plasmid) [Agrobacterium sp. MA01]|nr:hypothetical protein GH983_23800 [Agrobacterium sp. MA01]
MQKFGKGTNLRIMRCPVGQRKGMHMNNIIYIVGLVVIVIAVLSFFGLG